MKQIVTEAIVLRRTDYGEADRIINLLTPELGKVAALAKGVRKMKSKLAGGIELLAINEVTLIGGKSGLYTLRSARAKQLLTDILTDYDRNQQAFACMKQISRLIEEGEGGQFYPALKAILLALADGLDLKLAELWWILRILNLLGHTPNLETDEQGIKLKIEKKYMFSPDAGCFVGSNSSLAVGTEVIKLWRLALQLEPMSLNNIKQGRILAESHLESLRLFASSYI